MTRQRRGQGRLMRVPAPAEAGHDGCQSQGPKETNLLDLAPPYPAPAGLRTQIWLANSRHERTSEVRSRCGSPRRVRTLDVLLPTTPTANE